MDSQFIRAFTQNLFLLNIESFLAFLSSIQSKRDCLWCPHINLVDGPKTVVNVAEEVPVLIQDVDTLVVTVCCHDPTLAVCCDAEWIK